MLLDVIPTLNYYSLFSVWFDQTISIRLFNSPLPRFVAAIQHRRVDGMRFSIEDVSADVDNAFSVGSVDDCAAHARVVDKVVRVEQQVQVFGCFRQEERLHAVLFAVVADVFDLERWDKYTID